MNVIKVGDLSVSIESDNVIIDGKSYKNPGRSETVSIINNKIYIGKYVFKNGKFKFSWLAVWYNFL